MPIKTRIQIRRDTTANWAAAPNVLGRAILYKGEFGLDTDTNVLKVGDGVTNFGSLPPIVGGGSGPSVGGSPTQVLFIDASGNAIGDAELTFDAANNVMGVPAIGMTPTVSPPSTTNVLYASSAAGGDLQWSQGMDLGGHLTALSKSFDIPHPSKKKGRLVYGSLESPYHGVRLTGRAKTKNGKCIVKLPRYIKDLVKEEDCAVYLSNYGHGKVLYTEKIDIAKNRITIKVAEPVKGEELEFFWDFTAIRKDIPDLVVEP